MLLGRELAQNRSKGQNKMGVTLSCPGLTDSQLSKTFLVRQRRLVIQRLMNPLAIVEHFNVLEDLDSGSNGSPSYCTGRGLSPITLASP